MGQDNQALCTPAEAFAAALNHGEAVTDAGPGWRGGGLASLAALCGPAAHLLQLADGTVAELWLDRDHVTGLLTERLSGNPRAFAAFAALHDDFRRTSGPLAYRSLAHERFGDTAELCAALCGTTREALSEHTAAHAEARRAQNQSWTRS